MPLRRFSDDNRAEGLEIEVQRLREENNLLQFNWTKMLKAAVDRQGGKFAVSVNDIRTLYDTEREAIDAVLAAAGIDPKHGPQFLSVDEAVAVYDESVARVATSFPIVGRLPSPLEVVHFLKQSGEKLRPCDASDGGLDAWDVLRGISGMHEGPIHHQRFGLKSFHALRSWQKGLSGDPNLYGIGATTRPLYDAGAACFSALFAADLVTWGEDSVT